MIRSSLMDRKTTTKKANNADEIVSFNVGGTMFECYRKILNAFPESKLANIDKYGVKPPGKKEYFFDRNPLVFAHILDGYRSEVIHLPKDICGIKIKEELAFWNLSARHVSPCCFDTLYKGDDEIEIVEKMNELLQKNAGIIDRPEKMTLRQKIWLFLDEPKSSRPALAWCVFMSILIIGAALMEALATIPYFQVENDPEAIESIRKVTFEAGWSNDTIEKFASHKHHPAILYGDLVCHLILTIEFIVGAVVCADRCMYWKSPVRIAVLIAYLAYWMDIILEFEFYHVGAIEFVRMYIVLRYLTILMLFRLFYITKHIPAFNLIGMTFRSSKQELAILGLILTILVSMFGFVFYVSESLYNDDVHNVFTAMYWALISLTTVGYGDITPTTIPGFFIAGTCAVFGVIILALPIGIMASTFYSFYNYHRYARKHAAVCSIPEPISREHTSLSPRLTRISPLKTPKNRLKSSTLLEIQN